jgi:hypothetical protein
MSSYASKASADSDTLRGLKPGQATLDAIGGAHKLQSWQHNILTGACQYHIR